VVQAKRALTKRQNVTTVHCTELLRAETSRATAKLQLKASAEGCPYAAIVIGCCVSQRRSSFMGKGMNQIYPTESSQHFSCISLNTIRSKMFHEEELYFNAVYVLHHEKFFVYDGAYLRKLMKFHISFMEVGYVRSITNSRVQSS
jgi:hypothetical protein